MNTLVEIALYLAAWFLLVIVPGLLFTRKFVKEQKLSVTSFFACALLTGFAFHLLISLPLRTIGLTFTHTHLVAGFISVFILFRGRIFSEMKPLARFFFGWPNLIGLTALTIPLAWMTFSRPEQYYDDELYRMAIVPFILYKFPPVDFLNSAVSDHFRYYYCLEFWIAELHSLTRIPIETLYFRFILPTSWWIIWLCFQAWLNKTDKISIRDSLIGVGVLLFFIFSQPAWPPMAQLLFRQMAFCLALGCLSWTVYHIALKDKSQWLFAVVGIGLALATFAKASGGLLFTFLVLTDASYRVVKKEIHWKRVLSLFAFAACFTYLFYTQFIASHSIQQKPLDGIGSTNPVTREFFHVWFGQHRVGGWLGLDHAQFRNGYLFIFFAWMLITPLTMYLVGRKKVTSNPALWVTICVGFYLYVFTRFPAAESSILYWLFFGSYIFSILTYADWGKLFLKQRLSGTEFSLPFVVGLIFNFSWPVVQMTRSKAFDNIPETHWGRAHSEVCRILDRTAPTDAVFLHPRLFNYPIWHYGAFCRRRAFTTMFNGGINQNAELYIPQAQEAELFYTGNPKTPAVDWLKKNGICYVIWEENIYPFKDYKLETVVRVGDVHLLKRPDCRN